jgi:hypothetical protein
MRSRPSALRAALTTASLVALAMITAPAQAAPNLVQNGGFEVNGGPGFVNVPGTPSDPRILYTTLSGWINNSDRPGSWPFNILTNLP